MCWFIMLGKGVGGNFKIIILGIGLEEFCFSVIMLNVEINVFILRGYLDFREYLRVRVMCRWYSDWIVVF